jgi:hypothetical protein
MSANEEMTIDERYKYLRQMKKRYQKASRKEKGCLLDEMEAVTGQHRKGLTRLMNSSLERQRRGRERERVYGPDVGAAVSIIAESLDWVCPERLQPRLGWMADHLAKHGELVVSQEVRQKLDTVSISSVGRLLASVPKDRPRLPQRGPKRANQLTKAIPAGRIDWQEQQPGHFEVDLVHHCGLSASGNYVHTLQMVDIATGWSERVAVLGRSYRVMSDGFERILARLPFPVLELHPDNGSEFLNDHLVRFWGETIPNLHLSRSRAWQKNDNRFVEQKNDTLVRAYSGDERFDTVDQTNLFNTLYDHMWLFYNFFQPVMRLEEKVYLPATNGHPAHTTRRFDDARTPFDRLVASHCLPADQVLRLQTLRDSTNPRQLRLTIYTLLDQLFALPNTIPGSTQDVHLTLFHPLGDTPSPSIPLGMSGDLPILLKDSLEGEFVLTRLP